MTPKKQANPRRSVVIKVLFIYLAVALLVLFMGSLIGFYLGGPEGTTFALGIGILINLRLPCGWDAADRAPEGYGERGGRLGFYHSFHASTACQSSPDGKR